MLNNRLKRPSTSRGARQSALVILADLHPWRREGGVSPARGSPERVPVSRPTKLPAWTKAGGAGPMLSPRYDRSALSTARPNRAASPCRTSTAQPITQTLIGRLVAQAIVLATDAFDDEVAMTELRNLSNGDKLALEHAIRPACRRPPASPPVTAPSSCWSACATRTPRLPLDTPLLTHVLAVSHSRSAGERRRWASRARASAAEAP